MPPEPRLATHMLVSALIRRLSAQGDTATVLRKGDAVAGSLLLVTRCRGRISGLFEQFPSLDSGPIWTSILKQDTDNEQQISDYLERRQTRDPDIWVLELDVAFAERLNGLLALQG